MPQQQVAEGTTRATVELPDSLWEAAKTYALKQRISFRELIILSVREYLKRVKAPM